MKRLPLVLLLLCALLAAAGLVPAAAVAVTDYRLVGEVAGTSPDGFPYPGPVAADADGNAYVASSGVIYKYDAQGNFTSPISNWTTPGGQTDTFQGAIQDIGINQDVLWIIDRDIEYKGNDRIVQLNVHDGSFMRSFPCENLARAISFDSNGTAWVLELYQASSEAHLQEAFARFSPNGQRLERIDIPESVSPQQDPRDLAIGPGDCVYVTNYTSGDVLKFTNDGAYDDSWTMPGGEVTAGSIAVNAEGLVFVTNYAGGVNAFTSSGQLVSNFAYEDLRGQAGDVTVGATGDVYVGDFVDSSYLSRILVYHEIPTYTFVRDYPSSAGSWDLQAPFDVDVDMDGSVYVLDYNATSESCSIAKFDAQGARQWCVDSEAGPNASGLAVYDGLVYVTDSGPPGRIVVFDADGKRRETDDITTITGGNAPESWSPYAIRFDSAGTMWVSDVTSGEDPTKWVRQLATDGTQLSSFTSDDLQFPGSLSLDAQGNVYVSDTDPVLFKYDSAGQPLGTCPLSAGYPSGNGVDDDGLVYVAIYNTSWVEVFHSSGAPLTQFGDADGPGELQGATGMAVGPDGAIYVADQTGSVVKAYGKGEPGVDATPPTVTASTDPLPNAAGWFNASMAPVNVTLVAVDAGSGLAQVQYLVQNADASPPSGDDSGWLSYSDAVPIQLGSEGRWKVWFRASDVAGNWSTPEACEVDIDLSSPELSIVSPQASDSYDEDASVNCSFDATDSGSGIGEVWCEIDGSPTHLHSGDPIDTSVPGEHTFSVHAVDVAGNESTYTGTFTVSAPSDTTSPTTTAALAGTAGTNGWYRSSVTVDFTATDNDGGSGMSGGEAGTWYSFDDGATWTLGKSVTRSADGTYAVLYYSKDAASNREDDKSVSFKIDTTGPTAPSITGGGSSWFRTNQTVSAAGGGDATSGIAGHQYSIDGAEWASGDSVLVSAERTSGVAFRTVDNAGNASDAASVEVKIDKTPPLLGVFGPAGGFPDYGQWQNSDVPFGIHPVDQNPNPDYQYDCSGWDQPTLVPSDIAYSLDGGLTWLPFLWADGMDWDWIATLPAPPDHSNDGVHTVLCRAIDQAGNVGTKDLETGETVSFTIKIDTAPPLGAVAINGGAQHTNDPSVAINSSVHDTLSGVSRMRFSLDGGETWLADWSAYAANSVLDLPPGDGAYALTAQYDDGAGNVFTATDDLLLDTAPPTMGLEAILFPIHGYLGLDPTEWISEKGALFQTHDDDGTGSGVAGYSHIVNDAPGGPAPAHEVTSPGWGGVTIDSLPEGEHWVRLACVDNAGNWSVGGSPVETRIRIDTLAPLVTITAPADGATYAQNSPVSADWSVADATSGLSGSPIADAADGQPIDTSTLGGHSFTVSAMDLAGNPTTKTVSYTVVAAPTDSTAPSIVLGPAVYDGAAYGVSLLGQPLDFSVVDESGGSGASTNGSASVLVPGNPTPQTIPLAWTTNANGSTSASGTLPTGASGVYTLTLSGRDQAGNLVTKTLTYYAVGTASPIGGLGGLPRDADGTPLLDMAKYSSTKFLTLTFKLLDSAGKPINDATPRLYVYDTATGTQRFRAVLTFLPLGRGNYVFPWFPRLLKWDPSWAHEYRDMQMIIKFYDRSTGRQVTAAVKQGANGALVATPLTAAGAKTATTPTKPTTTSAKIKVRW